MKPIWTEASRRTLIERVVRLLAHDRAIAGLEFALSWLAEVPTALRFELLDAIVSEINSGIAQTLAAGMLDYDLDQVPAFTTTTADQAALIAWVNRVRALGGQHARADVTDVVIGQVLAHAPPDDIDGAWPHRFVREEFERAANDALERGLQTEKFNMRGVTTRGMYNGGDQERVPVDEYRDYARAIQRWPRTAAMLERMAEGWKRDAERGDVEARQRRLRGNLPTTLNRERALRHVRGRKPAFGSSSFGGID